MVPCKLVGDWGDNRLEITDECVPDRDAQIEYLGPLALMMYFESQTFVQDAFGDDSV